MCRDRINPTGRCAVLVSAILLSLLSAVNAQTGPDSGGASPEGKWTLTAGADMERGYVMKSPCRDLYGAGEKVRLWAMPRQGFTFTGWQGSVPTGQETANPLDVTLQADATFTATFEQIPSQLIICGYKSPVSIAPQEPRNDFLAVTGTYPSVGLKADGTLESWGKSSPELPPLPQPNTGYRGSEGNSDFFLGLKTDGSIVAWGKKSAQKQITIPAPNCDFVAVSVCEKHCLGLKRDGSVVAWGEERNPRGNAKTSLCSAPTPNTGFVAVAAGQGFNLGLKADGTLVSWGPPVTDKQQYTPSPNSDYIAISVFYNRIAGLKADGSINMWPSSYVWEEFAKIPAPNTDFRSVVIGGSFCAGLKRDGRMIFWGTNNFFGGQSVQNIPYLQIAQAGNYLALFRESGELRVDIRPFRATEEGALWRLTDEKPGIWHSSGHTVTFPIGTHTLEFKNTEGWYGVTTQSVTLARNKLTTASGEYKKGDATLSTAVEPQYGYVCKSPYAAVYSKGTTVTLWARPYGTAEFDHWTGDVPAGKERENPLKMEPSVNSKVVAHFTRKSGSIVAWGRNGGRDFSFQRDGGQWNTIKKNLSSRFKECALPKQNSGFVAVAAGSGFSLGLKEEGSIVAWGDNRYGQCRIPSPNSGYLDIVAEGSFSWGLREDGSIEKWGGGQGFLILVPGEPEPNRDYVALSAGGTGIKIGEPCTDFNRRSMGDQNFVALARGFNHTIFLLGDGSIMTKGKNDYGQCSVPSPNTDFIAISATGNSSFGLKTDGSIVAWGEKNCGLLDIPTPNTGFKSIFATGNRVTALKTDGSIVIWGENYMDYGQTTPPKPNTGFLAVCAGEQHTLAISELPAGKYKVERNAYAKREGIWTIIGKYWQVILGHNYWAD